MPEVNFPTPVHAVITFLVVTIISHLQVKSQFIKVSPYEEHSVVTWAIYITLFIYGVILKVEFGREIGDEALRTIIKRFSPLLGALVVVLHMLLLQWGFGCFTFALWVICLVGNLWPEIKGMYHCILEKIGGYFRGRYEQSNSGVREEALPPAATA